MPSFSLRSAAALAALTLAGCAAAQGSSSDVAARVNGHTIPMSAYKSQVSYQRVSTAEKFGGVDVCYAHGYQSLCKQLKRTALNNLIAEELVREFARQHKITVSNADFNRQWTVTFKSQFHANTSVLKAYARGYGVSVADLKDMVRQNMLQQAVMYRLTKNMPLYAPAVLLSRIEVPTLRDLAAVSRQLRAGKSFDSIGATLNHKKGSLCAAYGCGVLNWIPNALLPAAERKAATARVGSYVGPVYAQNGVSIFRVDAHAARLPLNVSEQLAMRQHIFSQWLNNQMKHARIERYAA